MFLHKRGYLYRFLCMLPIPKIGGIFMSPTIGDDHMLLLEANHITRYVQDRLLFEIKHLEIHSRDIIGLVGWNGSGKTSLLEVLSKESSPDEGTVEQHDTCVLLPQLKETSSTKSGGEITQAAIDRCLAKNPAVLLADEPTTNLDTDHIEKLESTFKRWTGALVIVSHDRAFLDALCKKIWDIQDGSLNEYKGNYSDYKAQKDLEIKQQQEAYEEYVKKKKQLEKAVQLKQQQAEQATKKPKNLSASEINAKGAKPYFAKKQKKLYQERKGMESRMEQLEKVDKVWESPPIMMNIPDADTLNGRIILRLADVTACAGSRTLWKHASIDITSGDKVAIIGANGSGKTTLIRKIMQKDTGITLSPAVKIGYFSQNLDILDTDQTILHNIKETSRQDETFIRIVLARLRFFRDDVHKKVTILSGGERVKVAFAKIFLSDINMLILDEPTNFLDIETMEALEGLLEDYTGTLLFVSHDRRFVDQIASRVVSIENQTIDVFNGPYKAYKAYVPQSGNPLEDNLLVLEAKISEVLGKLSTQPTNELEAEFQKLLKQKKQLENEQGAYDRD